MVEKLLIKKIRIFWRKSGFVTFLHLEQANLLQKRTERTEAILKDQSVGPTSELEVDPPIVRRVGEQVSWRVSKWESWRVSESVSV